MLNSHSVFKILSLFLSAGLGGQGGPQPNSNANHLNVKIESKNGFNFGSDNTLRY